MTARLICTFLFAFYFHLAGASDGLEVEQRHVSEALGHFIWTELKNDASTPLLLDVVIEGMRNADAGKPCPLSKENLQQCLMQFEDDHYKAQASKNLARAEQFLGQLQGKSDIQILVPERLYMQILSSGTRDVKKDDTPLFNIKCELLDGTELVNTFRTGVPVTQSPNTAIRGFKEGILGMKLGEKRRLYIHPEYGYGQFCHIDPNSLLIVEVELLTKPNQPKYTRGGKSL